MRSVEEDLLPYIEVMNPERFSLFIFPPYENILNQLVNISFALGVSDFLSSVKRGALSIKAVGLFLA